MPFVYSTLAVTQTYAFHKKGGADLPVLDPDRPAITIKGGTGVITKHLVTPKGFVTTVTDDQLALLLSHDLFVLHMNNGFMKFDTVKTSVKKAVEDMEPRDKSGPKIPSDFKAGKDPQPKFNKPE